MEYKNKQEEDAKQKELFARKTEWAKDWWEKTFPKEGSPCLSPGCNGRVRTTGTGEYWETCCDSCTATYDEG